MNYEHLKAFYTVCQYGSYSKAAMAMYTSQPAISRIINSLENELQIKLFYRTKNGVVLTKEGEGLYNEISMPFIKLGNIESEIKSLGESFGGLIYLGATVTALECYVFDLVDEFNRKFPNVKYRIYTGSSSSILEMVKSGKLDMAFITTPFDFGDDLVVTSVHTIDNVLVCGKKFKDAVNKEVSIKDLTSFPFVLLSNEMQFRKHINDFLVKNKVNIIPDFEADSSSVLLPMVKHGYGFGFIPYEMARSSIENGEVYLVKLKEKIEERYVTLVTSKTNKQTSIVRDITNFIIKKAKKR